MQVTKTNTIHVVITEDEIRDGLRESTLDILEDETRLPIEYLKYVYTTAISYLKSGCHIDDCFNSIEKGYMNYHFIKLGRDGSIREIYEFMKSLIAEGNKDVLYLIKEQATLTAPKLVDMLNEDYIESGIFKSTWSIVVRGGADGKQHLAILDAKDIAF